MFLLVLGLLRGNLDGWGSALIVAELAGGAAGLVAFVVIQHRSRAPMLPLGVFANRAFSGTQVSLFAISVSFFALYLYLTLYMLASGINDTFRQAGIPLGVAVYGALLPAGAAVGHGSPEAFVNGLHHAAWLAGAFALIGTVAGARRASGGAAPRPSRSPTRASRRSPRSSWSDRR